MKPLQKLPHLSHAIQGVVLHWHAERQKPRELIQTRSASGLVASDFSGSGFCRIHSILMRQTSHSKQLCSTSCQCSWLVLLVPPGGSTTGSSPTDFGTRYKLSFKRAIYQKIAKSQPGSLSSLVARHDVRLSNCLEPSNRKRPIWLQETNTVLPILPHIHSYNAFVNARGSP